MITANLAEAKKHLSRYAKIVKGGSTVVLCERNKPFAEIRPLPGLERPKPKRKLGFMKGMCPIGPEFQHSDPEIAESFLQSRIFPSDSE